MGSYLMNLTIKSLIIFDNVEITMKEISKVSSIRFVKRTDQLHFIEIVDKGEYWSSVGKQGGNQELSVTTGWQNPVGSAIHELLHSCGMFHEHSRPVKDKYVVVRRNGDFNYKKLKSSNVKCYSKYDFESIMHYPLTLCMDVKPGVKKQNSKIGQRVKLSKGIKAINKHAFPHKREEREDKHFKMPEKKFSPCDAERRSKEKKE